MSAYADLTYANTYFTTRRLHHEAWDNASDPEKTLALQEATDAIDELNYAGDKANDAQVNQFPRGNDTLVPGDIKDACCELAFSLIDDRDPEIEAELAGTLKRQLGNAQSQTDGSQPSWVMAGIPSFRAWKKLIRYLRDARSGTTERGS